MDHALAPLRLQHLRIARYRNAKRATELHFGRHHNVLLGKNSSGKSTLLRLIAAIVSDDFSELSHEHQPVTLEWTLEGDDTKMSFGYHQTLPVAEDLALTEATDMLLRRRRRRDVARCVWISLAETQRTLVFKTPNAECHPGLAPEAFESAVMVDSTEASSPRFLLLKMRFEGREELRSDPIVLQYSKVRLPLQPAVPFDEALDMYRSSFPPEAGEPGYAVEFQMDDEGDVIYRAGRFPYEPFAAAVTAASMRPNLPEESEIENADSPPRAVAVIASQWVPHWHAAVLNLGFVDAMAAFAKAQDDSSEDGGRTVRYSTPQLLFKRADGSLVREYDLSFGQKRLLTFFLYLDATGPGPVVADELVNGLHYEWIATAIGAIGARQSFLASQNPLLVDHLAFDSAADVKDAFIVCKRDEESGCYVWANLTDSTARSLYSSYEQGIMHVSEVLLTSGLW